MEVEPKPNYQGTRPEGRQVTGRRGATQTRTWIGVAVVVVTVGCGIRDVPVGGSTSARVDTLEGGRVRVVNSGPAWSEGNAWTAEEELRIGTVEGGGPQQFGQISALKADSDGRIYVLDYQSQDIRVFDVDGTYSHTIGSKGEGPGELMQAAGLNWGPSGNLWVWDPQGRFSVFTPTGEFVESRPRRVRGVLYPWRGEFDVDGSLIDWGLDYPGMVREPGWSPHKVVYYPVRFSGDFEQGDTLPTLEFDFEMTDGGQPMVFSEGLSPFQDRNGAIWFAHNKTFTLYRRTLEGDTTLQFSISRTPASVTGSDIDSVRAPYVERGRAGDAPTPDMFASTKPMIRRIFGDTEGNLFVLSEQEGLALGTFVDVFRGDGHYLGRIDLPTPINFPYPPPYATDTHLYYVTTDDLDVEYVVRVRLNKPGSPTM